MNGTAYPDQKKTSQPVGMTLQMAAGAYLAEIERGVASYNKRKGTLQLAKTTLKKFSEHAKVQYLSEITVDHLDNDAAWCIATSPTHSPQTGRNEFLRVNQFLKSYGIVLTKRNGDKFVPVGMKDVPKVPQRTGVITHSPEELEKFFASCNGFKQWGFFQTFQRAGLREMELATLRPEDIILNTAEPYIDVCKRTVGGYEFIPKWYQERHVNIDPELADLLKKLKSTCRSQLVFGTKGGRLNLHLLRECKRIAVRAGLLPARFRLHRFRANFATHCLRQNLD